MEIVISKSNVVSILSKFAQQLNTKINGLVIKNMDLSKSDFITDTGTGNKILSNAGIMVDVDVEKIQLSITNMEGVDKVITVSKISDTEYTFTTDEIEIAEEILKVIKTDGNGDKFLDNTGNYVEVEEYVDMTEEEITSLVNSL